MSDLTCLSKRDFLLLLCWVSTFLLYAPSYESIVVILSSMCMVPRFLLIDSWLWYDLFSNYLFLVTLVNFKGVLAFMFCYLMDKLNTTLCFFYALDNHFTFHALYTLSLFDYFSCYSMVAEFIAMLYLPCLCCFIMIPAAWAFTIVWSWLCDSMSPQKLFLLSLTYSGRAGVKLGDADTLQTYL